MDTGILIGLILLAVVGITLPILVIRFGNKGILKDDWHVDPWTKNVELHVSGNTFEFDFPQKDGVHGIMKDIDGLNIGDNLSASFQITGDQPRFIAAGAEPRVGFYILAGRIYSNFQHGVDCRLGVTTLTVRLFPENWSTVDGKPCTDDRVNFLRAVEGAVAVGLVFGDWHGYAHGVHLDGPAGGSASFQLLDSNL